MVITNCNPEGLNSTLMLFRHRKKISNILRLNRSTVGHITEKMWNSGLSGIPCEHSLRSFSHQNVRGENGEAKTFYLGAHFLTKITSPLPQPPACFSSLWYECRLLEDTIVWRVKQKKGEKKNEKESAINLLLGSPSDHHILLSFIISSSVSALYLCLPPPFAPLSHLQSRPDVCDGSPFSSVPSSQTNISQLSTLFLLLLCPDTISRKLLAIVFPWLSVLH